MAFQSGFLDLLPPPSSPRNATMFFTNRESACPSLGYALMTIEMPGSREPLARLLPSNKIVIIFALAQVSAMMYFVPQMFRFFFEIRGSVLQGW